MLGISLQCFSFEQCTLAPSTLEQGARRLSESSESEQSWPSSCFFSGLAECTFCKSEVDQGLSPLLSRAQFLDVLMKRLRLFVIVFTSVILGSILPLIYERVKIDPAHAGTSIQVLMDILGVWITCVICNWFLG
mmetsp:Transcript_73011/g.171634  ORF Transcript_73011/g.171634 Transcript_73011/m.171634 type:complete len:134 (-) Transcript_73011:76-477(-)